MPTDAEQSRLARKVVKVTGDMKPPETLTFLGARYIREDKTNGREHDRFL